MTDRLRRQALIGHGILDPFHMGDTDGGQLEVGQMRRYVESVDAECVPGTSQAGDIALPGYGPGFTECPAGRHGLRMPPGFPNAFGSELLGVGDRIA